MHLEQTQTIVLRPENDGAPWGKALSLLHGLADATCLRMPPRVTERDLRDALRSSGRVLVLTFDDDGYLRAVLNDR